MFAVLMFAFLANQVGLLRSALVSAKPGRPGRVG